MARKLSILHIYLPHLEVKSARLAVEISPQHDDILTHMQHEINVTALSEAVQRQREGKSMTVRAAADQIGQVSASTLSRIERGNLPDLDTYMRICRWLEVDPSHFVAVPINKSTPTKDSMLQKQDIITHLRADKLLTQQTREALITMIEVAYAAARRNLLPNEAQD